MAWRLVKIHGFIRFICKSHATIIAFIQANTRLAKLVGNILMGDIIQAMHKQFMRTWIIALA
jgi:hypothetical protein